MNRFLPPFAKSLAAALLALVLWLPSAAQAQKLHFVQATGPPDQAQGWMSHVAFSADGRSIIANNLGNTGAIWSFPGGALLRRLAHEPLASSPDLRYYSWITDPNLNHGKWDAGYGETASDQALSTIPGGGFYFSPDGQFVVRYTADHVFEVAQLRTGKVIGRISQRFPGGTALAPDNRTLATGHWDLIKLWDVPSGQRRKVLRGMQRYVTALNFSPHGKRLAAGSDFGGVQLWNVATGKRLWSVQLHGGLVSDPAFSPDGKLIAVGTYGTGTVWLLRARDGTLADKAKVSDLGCGSVAFSPDGRYLITPSTGGLVKWPYDDGGTVRVFEVRR
jgi:WD40 repeat protein